MKKKNIINIYNEIFSLLDKYSDKIVFDIRKLRNEADNHLYKLMLKEKYDIDVEYATPDFTRIDDYRLIGVFGERTRRSISWSDDGRKPKDKETLYVINFATGAYMFGDDYPQGLFNKMWVELCSYSPKYKDTVNKSLYFSLDHAKEVHKAFPEIIKKYYDVNKRDVLRRKKEQLEKELKSLEVVLQKERER